MMWGRKGKKAAIFGCGPSGLFAAHALAENGWRINIFSNKRKSDIYGAQYLHAPIPGLTPDNLEPVTIKYHLVGEQDIYRAKVYGSQPVNTSVEALETEHLGWDLRATYDRAWEEFGERVINVELGKDVLRAPVPAVDGYSTLDLARFDLILNSVPLNRICYRDSHQFHSAEVWAMGDAPRRGQYVPYRPAANTVECNGTWDTGWYRAANVYGHSTMEWPARNKPPLPAVARVTKPIYSDCDCYRNGELGGAKYFNIGRYGSWRKSVLTHHAYTQAAQL